MKNEYNSSLQVRNICFLIYIYLNKNKDAKEGHQFK